MFTQGNQTGYPWYTRQLLYQLSYFVIIFFFCHTCGWHVVECLVEDVEVSHQHPHSVVCLELGTSLDQLQGAWQCLNTQ